MAASFFSGFFPKGLASTAPRLASASELRSPESVRFVDEINAFARQHGLREIGHEARAWIYPWLHQHGMGAFDWRGRELLCMGSGANPLPWWLAHRGARLTLVDTDKQWPALWERVRTSTGGRATWNITSSEHLPFVTGTFDAVASISMLGRQTDKVRAVDELARVLKRGGPLFVSFDIVEPSLGMSFPANNGVAATLEGIEKDLWLHPAFKNEEKVSWNLDDVPAFQAWQRESDPTHNHIAGAAVLVKR